MMQSFSSCRLLLLFPIASLLVTSAYAEPQTLWVREYNGQRSDAAVASGLDSQGNVIVAGSSTNALGNLDFYTVKYDGITGATAWEKFFHHYVDDYPQAIAIDSLGNAVVSGFSAGATSTLDMYTVKYAAEDAAVLWQSRKRGRDVRSVKFLAVDNEDQVVMAGITVDGSDLRRVFIQKLSSLSGAKIWGQQWGPVHYYVDVFAMKLDREGNIFIAGKNPLKGNFLVKFSPDGVKLWQVKFVTPGTGTSSVRAIATTGKGDLVAMGTCSSPVEGNRYFTSESDFYTVRYSGLDGSKIWAQRHGGADSSDEPVAVAVDVYENVVVLGRRIPLTSRFSPDYHTASYYSNGTLRWEATFEGNTGVGGYPASLALHDQTGRVYVSGTTPWRDNLNQVQNISTVVGYSVQDGSLVWQKLIDRYTRSSNVATDADDNVILSATIQEGPSSNYTNYYTAKFSSTP